MEKQEYLFIPDEFDREFSEMDEKIAAVHPDYAAVPEEKRRVAYFLVSRIRTEKMPFIAGAAKVSLGKCYELIKDPECRTAQDRAGKYVYAVEKQLFQSALNDKSSKIARLAREKKLKPVDFSEDMFRICRAAEPRFQLTPVEFFYLGLNRNDYLSSPCVAPDQECLERVKVKLKEIDQ